MFDVARVALITDGGVAVCHRRVLAIEHAPCGLAGLRLNGPRLRNPSTLSAVPSHINGSEGLAGAEGTSPSKGRGLERQGSVLDKAELELEEYVGLLTFDEEAEMEARTAFDYLRDARMQAGEAEDPQQQLRLETLVRELLSRGDIRDVVRSLATLARLDRKAAVMAAGSSSAGDSGALNTTEGTLPVPGLTESPTSPQRREQLVKMFKSMDIHGTGTIDAGQFRDAMRSLGAELSGDATAIIFEAMDIHGFLNLDQFLAIVEAEEVRSHSSLARMLHRLHIQPRWWTDNPTLDHMP